MQVGEEIALLKGITGSFRPGVLTALMGASGAGKVSSREGNRPPVQGAPPEAGQRCVCVCMDPPVSILLHPLPFLDGRSLPPRSQTTLMDVLAGRKTGETALMSTMQTGGGSRVIFV